MSRSWGRRALRPEPENGWLDWELVGVLAGAPLDRDSLRIDLPSGRLLAGSAGPTQSESLASRPERWDGTGLLAVTGMTGAPLGEELLRGLESLHGALRLVHSSEPTVEGLLDELRGRLPDTARLDCVFDGTRWIGDWVRGRFANGEPSAPAGDLLVPWIAGLWTASEMEDLAAWAAQRGFGAVVPVVVEPEPRTLRRFAEQVELSESRTLRLFLQGGAGGAPVEHRLDEHRTAIDRSGLRWWIDRIPDHPSVRFERIRRVSGALGLLGLLGAGRESTGWVEGHRQAARRLEVERIDVRDLLRDGNLRLLDWLDRRVQDTLTGWFAATRALDGEPPALERLRADRRSGSHDVADSGA